MVIVDDLDAVRFQLEAATLTLYDVAVGLDPLDTRAVRLSSLGVQLPELRLEVAALPRSEADPKRLRHVARIERVLACILEAHTSLSRDVEDALRQAWHS